MAQWITRLTTDQAIAGSSPAMLVFLLSYLSFFVCFILFFLQREKREVCSQYNRSKRDISYGKDKE